MPEIVENDRLLSYLEAGKLLGLSARTVRVYADQGRLERVTLSPQTMRVTESSVRALIERSKMPIDQIEQLA